MSGKYERIEAGQFRRKYRPLRAFVKLWPWLLTALCLVCAVICVVCAVRYASCRNGLLTQQAAERWQGASDRLFSQNSVFFTKETAIDRSTIDSARKKVNDGLKIIHVEPAPDASPDASMVTDCYTAVTSLTVHGGAKRPTATTKTLAVGGDYFLFHPLQLLSGAYLTKDALMKDRVVLDKGLAWYLFGATDVAGMEVTINERPFLVAGVVEIEQDFATKEAFDDSYLMFMDYDAVQQLQGEAMPGITCYEIVLPEANTDYGYSTVKDIFPDAEIVNNTGRYEPLALWQVLKDFGKRSMNKNGITYPYWENAARMSEDHAAFSLLMALIFGILPAFCILFFGIRAIIRFIIRVKNQVTEDVERKSEENKQKHYVRTGI